MFFGRIFRDYTKTIKQLQILNNAQIVVQTLPEPEDLDQNTLVLLLCKRLVGDRTYTHKQEMKYTFKGPLPLIADLIDCCKKHLFVDEG